MDYDSVYRAGREFNRYPSEPLVSWVFNNKLSQNLVCLDIGCGHGNNLRFLLEYGFDAHGIDNSNYVISLIKEEFQQRVSVQSIVSTDFACGKFDLLIDRQSIQHNNADELIIIFEECNRLLKKDGLFFCNFNLSNGIGPKKADVDEATLDEIIRSKFLVFEKNYYSKTTENGSIHHKSVVFSLMKN